MQMEQEEESYILIKIFFSFLQIPLTFLSFMYFIHFLNKGILHFLAFFLKSWNITNTQKSFQTQIYDNSASIRQALRSPPPPRYSWSHYPLNPHWKLLKSTWWPSHLQHGQHGFLNCGQTHTFPSHHNEETCCVWLLYSGCQDEWWRYKKADDRSFTSGIITELEKRAERSEGESWQRRYARSGK